MASVITINGSVVNRPASRLVLNRVNMTLDGYDWIEFTEKAVRPPGTFGARKSCVLAVDGVTVFSGEVVGSYYGGIGRGPIDIGYRALGLEWLANRVQVTAADGSGQLIYNLRSTDRDYVSANSGLSVGDILTKLFDLHATQLGAAGVTGYTAGDLTALVVVPPEPILLSGGLWNCVRHLLNQWHNKYVAFVDPSNGKVVIKDQLSLTASTLTLDSDPIVVDSLSRDTSECFTSVVCRGAAKIEAAYLTLTKDATLIPGWTAPQQAAWSLADYLQPKDAADVGDVTSMSSTTLTVSSDSAAAHWIANYWGPLNAEVVALDPAATGITFSEARRITSNTALTAGGSSVLTVDAPFNNSGYSRYSIRGSFAEDALTWRKFLIAPTGVAQHLVRNFSHSFQWSPQDGVVVQTDSPQALICWSSDCSTPYQEFPATFEIVPYDGTTDGYIVFSEPVLTPFGSRAKMIAGGASVDGVPCEIIVMVPYSVGSISSVAPSSGHEGTAYTVDGLENVLYRDFPQWTDYKDEASYAVIAQETLDTVKNTVVEGNITYFGKYSTALTKGRAINLAAVGYTTGFEAIDAPMRSVTLDYAPDGGPDGAGGWITQISFSNRLKPFCGDRLYAHPVYGSRAALAGASIDTTAASASFAASLPKDQASSFGELDADTADAAMGSVGGGGERGDYHGRRRPEPRKARGSGLSKKEINDRNKDDAESRRRVAARGSRRSADLLDKVSGRGGSAPDAGPTSLDEFVQSQTASQSPRPIDANDVGRDDRESRRRVAERGSRRSGRKLSAALGNPTGRKAKGQTEEQFQSDRDADAHLADIMGGKPRGAGGSSAASDVLGHQ